MRRFLKWTLIALVNLIVIACWVTSIVILWKHEVYGGAYVLSIVLIAFASIQVKYYFNIK